MTQDEFEENKRRFGPDVDAWPAPYKQQALDILRDEAGLAASSGDERALDRLVLDAALMETDEQALARKVLARIGAERRGSPFGSWSWLTPAAMAAGVAAILATATAAGYTLASEDGSFESDLLAFAVGAPELAADTDQLPDEPVEQEDLL